MSTVLRLRLLQAGRVLVKEEILSIEVLRDALSDAKISSTLEDAGIR